MGTFLVLSAVDGYGTTPARARWSLWSGCAIETVRTRCRRAVAALDY